MNTFLGWAHAPGALDIFVLGFTLQERSVGHDPSLLLGVRTNSECKVTSNCFFLFKADDQRPAVAVQ
jgi:hypothetical protein